MLEKKYINGLELQQQSNDYLFKIDPLFHDNLNSDIIQSMEIGFNSLAYIQSNSIIFLHNSKIVGIGAGQQNRVDAIRLAGKRAQLNLLRNHPKCIHMISGFKPDVNITKFTKHMEVNY